MYVEGGFWKSNSFQSDYICSLHWNQMQCAHLSYEHSDQIQRRESCAHIVKKKPPGSICRQKVYCIRASCSPPNEMASYIGDWYQNNKIYLRLAMIYLAFPNRARRKVDCPRDAPFTALQREHLLRFVLLKYNLNKLRRADFGECMEIASRLEAIVQKTNGFKLLRSKSCMYRTTLKNLLVQI
jgi:hypothetical protein